MVYRYELTEFPEILKNTYWGQGSAMNDSSSIVQNYNDFVRAHSIVRALDRVPIYAESKARAYYSSSSYLSDRPIRSNNVGVKCLMGMDHGIDHLQYFQDRSDNYVLITSPYALRSDGTFLIEHGWERIPGLHIEGESSYIFKVPKRRRTGSSEE